MAASAINLCSDRWSIRTARETAKLLSGRYTILLGSKVCAAFDVPFEPFQMQFPSTKDGGGGILVFPHPSGLCRLWNDPTSVVRARVSIAKFAPELKDSIGDLTGGDGNDA